MPEGRCLCGAVRVTVRGDVPGISACFCANCRRWGGGVQMGFAVTEGDVAIKGPVKTHRSSRLAERAWCDACGSAVLFRYVEGPDAGHLELCPGLFDDFAGAALERVVYADRAPGGLAFAGNHETWTAARYEARWNHLTEGETP